MNEEFSINEAVLVEFLFWFGVFVSLSQLSASGEQSREAVQWLKFPEFSFTKRK